MQGMCHNQTIDGQLKHFPKKINKVPSTILDAEKTENINKGTTVDTINLQPGELIHTDLEFYNITSIRGFTSILTVVSENNIMHGCCSLFSVVRMNRMIHTGALFDSVGNTHSIILFSHTTVSMEVKPRVEVML